MKEINFVDTTIRDGQQSLWATGMRTAMILPIAERLDEAGFVAIELMSAPFVKKMVRELREDPWERMDLVRQRVRKTPLRTTRGRHSGAFQITPRSIEELWDERLAAHGIRQMRLSDPSNTPARWQERVKHARKVGIDPVINLIYSISPKHTDAYYAGKAEAAAELDVHGICLKDPGGLLTPERIRTLVPAVLQNAQSIPVELHTHCNTGLGPLCALEAIQLGIRIINTAIPPLANGPSNPSLFNVIKNMRALGYVSAVNDVPLRLVAEHFATIAKREGLPLGAPAEYDSSYYIHQVPGGMISNLQQQLSNSGIGDRLEEVLDEISKVREDFGFPIMVTPYSQFVGAQAAVNVICGERYKQVLEEVILYALGFWGEEESSSINPNVRDRILNAPRAKAVASWQPPQPSLSEMRQRYGGSTVTDEDLLLRYLAGEDQVSAMRAEGSFERSRAIGCNLVSLVEALSKRPKIDYLQIQKDTMSMTLRSSRAAS